MKKKKNEKKKNMPDFCYFYIKFLKRNKKTTTGDYLSMRYFFNKNKEIKPQNKGIKDLK